MINENEPTIETQLLNATGAFAKSAIRVAELRRAVRGLQRDLSQAECSVANAETDMQKLQKAMDEVVKEAAQQ